MTSYKNTYSDRQSEAISLNNIKSSDLRLKDKEREYKFPPLPNNESAKAAFMA